MAETPQASPDPVEYLRQKVLADAEDIYYESVMAEADKWIAENAVTGMNVGDLRRAVLKGIEAATDRMKERFGQ